jgi:outer membrane protein assembly factor BamB
LYLAAHQRADGAGLYDDVPPGLSAVFLGTPEGMALSQTGAQTLILAVEAYSGRVIWERTIDGAITFAPLLLSNGILYHGNTNGSLKALDARSGDVLMTRQIGGSLNADGIIEAGPWITAMSLVDNRLLVSVMPRRQEDSGGVFAFGLQAE